MKFRLGTGTMLTVLLALGIGGYSVYQQRRLSAQPPLIERTVQGATAPGIAPVPEFLLGHRAALGLSDAQAQRIHALAASYRKDVAPYQQQLRPVSADYQQQVERAQGGKRLSIQQLQQAGSDVQRVSSIMATTRQSYWRQARAVLTTAQQAKLDGMLAGVKLRDLQ